MSSLTREQRSAITFENADTSDCGVVALMAVAKIKRARAERILKKFGYTPSGGTPRGAIEQALRELKIGYEMTKPDLRDTAATYSLSHEYGRFLLYVECHVMALVDGDLFNSRGHWHDRLDKITAIKETP